MSIKTLKNGPQKLLIIGPDPFISQSSPDQSPQPRIDFSYYEISGPDICSLICGVESDLQLRWTLLVFGGWTDNCTAGSMHFTLLVLSEIHSVCLKFLQMTDVVLLLFKKYWKVAWMIWYFWPFFGQKYKWHSKKAKNNLKYL